MSHMICDILPSFQYARRKSAKMFQKKDKNNEEYIPETERFKEQLEIEEKKAEKRKSSSNSNSKIKKTRI